MEHLKNRGGERYFCKENTNSAVLQAQTKGEGKCLRGQRHFLFCIAFIRRNKSLRGRREFRYHTDTLATGQ